MFDLFTPQSTAAPEGAGGGSSAALAVRPLDPADDLGAVDIFSRATVLQLGFRRLGTQRKIDTSDIEITGDQASDTKTDKSLVRASMSILDSPELKAIEKHDGATARYVGSQTSGPAFANHGGFYLLGLPLKDKIDQWLDDRQAARLMLIEDLIGAYEQRRAQTAARLGPLASRVAWPSQSEVRAAFDMTRRYMTFGYSNEAEAAAWKREALTECRATLRAAFASLVANLAERLQPDEDGQPKTFRDSLVRKFDDFVSSFEARNIADDQVLADLVRQSRDIMRGVDASKLRNSGGLRDTVARSMADVKKAAAAMVVDTPTRRYSDDD